MLAKLGFRGAFQKWYSLKTPTYLQLQDVHLLREQFSANHLNAQRLEYLNKLEEDNRLKSFYQNKSLAVLTDDELFFLMDSNTSFHLSKLRQEEAITKVHSVYFKCLLYKEFSWFNEVQKYLIVLSMNEQVIDMSPRQIVFCLSIIQDFEVASQTLDLSVLESTLLNYAEEPAFAHEMLLINSYMSKMGMKLPTLLTSAFLHEWILNNKVWDFSSIYCVFRLTEELGLDMKPELRGKLDRLMKQALEQFKRGPAQSDYLVFLLKYYPEYAQELNIQHFTPKAYLDYLFYFHEHPSATLKLHNIPVSILKLASQAIFTQILVIRLELKMDTILSIARSLSDYFVSTLNPIKIYFSYLRQQKAWTTEIEYLFERAFKAKFNLAEFQPQKLEQFQLHSVINLLAKMGRMGLCSVDFWRITVRWIEQLLAYNDKQEVIEFESGIYLNLLSLVISKNFKEQTREAIYQKMNDLLGVDRHWPLKKLMRLTNLLAYNKIGEHKLWILIEHRLYEYVKYDSESTYRVSPDDTLSKIALNFSYMNRGSFQLWDSLNKTLSNKLKKEILEKVKQTSSQAHLYLKVTPNMHS